MSQGLYDVTQNSQIQIITFFDPVENRVKFHYVDSKFSEHIGYLDLFGQFRLFIKLISIKCSKFQWIDFMSV